MSIKISARTIGKVYADQVMRRFGATTARRRHALMEARQQSLHLKKMIDAQAVSDAAAASLSDRLIANMKEKIKAQNDMIDAGMKAIT